MKNWLRRLLGLPCKVDLICLPLHEMLLVHPEMILETCALCCEKVGVYPSGQQVIAIYGRENVNVFCGHCRPPVGARPAPGALLEPKDSIPRSASRWRHYF